MASFEERLAQMQRDVHPLISEESVWGLIRAEEQLFQGPRDITVAINTHLSSDVLYRASPPRLYALADLILILNDAVLNPLRAQREIPEGMPIIDWAILGNITSVINPISDAGDYIRAAVSVFEHIHPSEVQDATFLRAVATLYCRDNNLNSQNKFHNFDITQHYQTRVAQQKEGLSAIFSEDDFIVARMIEEEQTNVPEYRHRLLEMNREKLLGGARVIVGSRLIQDTPDNIYTAMTFFLSACVYEARKKVELILQIDPQQFLQQKDPDVLTHMIEVEREKKRLRLQKYEFLSALIEEERDYIMKWFDEE